MLARYVSAVRAQSAIAQCGKCSDHMETTGAIAMEDRNQPCSTQSCATVSAYA
jgi:hypothetical protein